MSVTPEQFLMGGGGAPSAKFKTIGDTIAGQVLDYEMRQQSDLETNSLKTWDDGRPMMQLVVTLQTTERDASIEDDDGKRRIYIKGLLQQAVRDAIKAAGGKKLEVGGTLTVRYVGDEAPKRRGVNGAKIYQAHWQPGADAFLGETPVAAPAPASVWNTPPAAPAAAPVAAVPAQATQPDPQALAAALAQLTPEQRQMMGLPA
jgi:hypothetical protein